MSDDQHAKIEERHIELAGKIAAWSKDTLKVRQLLADFERAVAAQARREALGEVKGFCQKMFNDLSEEGPTERRVTLANVIAAIRSLAGEAETKGDSNAAQRKSSD